MIKVSFSTIREVLEFHDWVQFMYPEQWRKTTQEAVWLDIEKNKLILTYGKVEDVSDI